MAVELQIRHDVFLVLHERLPLRATSAAVIVIGPGIVVALVELLQLLVVVAEQALALLPLYVAERTTVSRVSEVEIP